MSHMLRHLYGAQGGRCFYCNIKLLFRRHSQYRTVRGKPPYTIDHFVPKSWKGPNTWRNYVLACYDCNLKKGDSLPRKKTVWIKFNSVQAKAEVLAKLYRKKIVNRGKKRKKRPKRKR